MQNFHRSNNKNWRAKLIIQSIMLCFVGAFSLFSHADYKKIIEEDFWKKVYPQGGKTFYCQNSFDKKTPILAVSHIFPSSIIVDELGCRSERSCLRSNEKYQTIISDMHNMVPINSFYALMLKDSLFGELEASNKPNECGIKKRYTLIEPPDNLKGDVARIHFYMHRKYNLPLDSKFNFLKAWDKKDPPDAAELAKNKRIKEIQGNENPFLVDRALVDKLDF